MIIEDFESIKRNTDNDSSANFLYPQYGKNCISEIPDAILKIFDVKNTNAKSPLEKHIEKIDCKKINNVVLLVLDGFGFNQFLRYYKTHKFLAKLANKGDVFPITSVFPSQTTNALTTLNTGLAPQEHALFEYAIYLKEVGMIVNTLWFEQVGSKHRIRLLDEGFDAKILFNGKTIHSTLNEKGINTFTHMTAPNAYSACSKLIFEGSTVVPSMKTSDLIVNLRKNLERNSGRAYFFVHLDTLDTIAHMYGPQSYEYGTELSAISYLLNKELVEKITPKTAKNTLILVTADHGGVDVVPEETTYLNWFPEVIANLQCGKDENRISPTGSPRDVFLHVRDEKLTETRELLSKKVGKKAQVVETKEAVKNCLFGLKGASNKFFERAGNLLILPYRNETIWIEDSEGRKNTLLGHHGGLNKEEMLVPFAIVELNNLK